MNNKIEELEKLVTPVCLWLQENYDPHAVITISQYGAELLRGECTVVLSHKGE